MSWNKRAIGLAIPLLLTSASGFANAEEIACPVLSDTHLRYVQVFDGKPEEQVSLIADHADDRQGYWKLGYVYDKGRSVTVQCVYANKATRDFVLSQRVDECRYHIDESSATKLDCQ